MTISVLPHLYSVALIVAAQAIVHHKLYRPRMLCCESNLRFNREVDLAGGGLTERVRKESWKGAKVIQFDDLTCCGR
jgi:hypothetical protein